VRLLAGKLEARQAVQELMQRDLKPEATP
jgi:hypothetical protein